MKIAVLFLGLAMFALPAVAQQPELSASSDAVAVHYNGEWSVGTRVTESFDFLDFGAKKSNHIYLLGTQLVAPGPELNLYIGGIKIQPDLTRLLNKTNVAPSALNVTFDAGAGNGIPSIGGSHVSFTAGGGLQYQLTSSLSWKSIQAHYNRFGSTQFVDISTGLTFAFSGTK